MTEYDEVITIIDDVSKKKTNTIYILLQQIVIVKKQDIATLCTQFY